MTPILDSATIPPRRATARLAANAIAGILLTMAAAGAARSADTTPAAEHSAPR